MPFKILKKREFQDNVLYLFLKSIHIYLLASDNVVTCDLILLGTDLSDISQFHS